MTVKPHAEFSQQTRAQLPTVLQPRAERHGVHPRGGAAEGLDEQIGTALGERVERGEEIEAGVTAAEIRVERDAVYVHARAEPVRARIEVELLHELIVALGARRIHAIKLAERGDARDFKHRHGRPGVGAQVHGAPGPLQADIVHHARRNHAEPVAHQRMIGGEAAALRGTVREIVGALHFVAHASAREGVARRERVAIARLVIELEGKIGAARAGGIEVPHGAKLSRGIQGRRESAVDGGERRVRHVGPFLRGFVLMLHGAGEERAVPPERAVGGDSGLIAAEARAHGGDLGAAGVEQLVLREHREVAMQGVDARARDHVEEAAGRAAEFGSHGDARHAKLLHHLEADGDAIAAGGFVAIVEAVNLNGVVARAHAAEGEARVAQRRARAGHGALRTRAGRGRHAGRGEDEVEVVAASRGRFLDALVAERDAGGGRGEVDGFGLLLHLDALVDARGLELEVLRDDMAGGERERLHANGHEAGRVGVQRVGSGREAAEEELPVRRGEGGALDAGVLMADGDFAGGHGGAGGVANEALDDAGDAGGLGVEEGGGGEEDGEEDARQHGGGMVSG